MKATKYLSTKPYIFRKRAFLPKMRITIDNYLVEVKKTEKIGPKSFYGFVYISPMNYKVSKKWDGNLKHPFRFKEEVVEIFPIRYGAEIMLNGTNPHFNYEKFKCKEVNIPKKTINKIKNEVIKFYKQFEK